MTKMTKMMMMIMMTGGDWWTEKREGHCVPAAL